MGFAEGTVLTPDLVKTRKRELAKLYHPDHGGSPEAMTKLNRAADILLESLK